jgi:4a-hydroxytetrahydrobiopterin dehydratase
MSHTFYRKFPMDLQPIASRDLEAALAGLPGWTLQDGKLRRQFKFPNFVSAFGFMTQMAFYSESIGHHPEWSNVYNRVTVDLTTHDAGGITQKDIDWAKKGNTLV